MVHGDPLGRAALRAAGAADRRPRTAHLHGHDAQHPGRRTSRSSASPAPPRSRRRSSSAPGPRPTRSWPASTRLHETIKGELPEAAGVHPAGTPYSAFDPELMLWTLAVIADSGRAMYETMVRPLERRGAREPLAGLRPLRRALPACRAREMPATYREFEAWFEGKLASPDLHATEHALEMAPLVAFEQPVPAAARGNIAIQNHLIKGTLPPRVREIFGIRWSAAHERSFRAMAAAHRRARRAFPLRDAPRPQRLLLRPRHPRRAAARRHRSPRSCAPADGSAGRLACAPGRGAGTSPQRKVPSLKRDWPRACRRPVSQRALM